MFNFTYLSNDQKFPYKYNGCNTFYYQCHQYSAVTMYIVPGFRKTGQSFMKHQGNVQLKLRFVFFCCCCTSLLNILSMCGTYSIVECLAVFFPSWVQPLWTGKRLNRAVASYISCTCITY